MIREITEQDILTVTNLLNEAFHKNITETQTKENFLNKQKDHNHLGYFIDDHLVGIAEVTIFSTFLGKEAVINNIVVKKEMQGKHIGSNLMKKIEEILQEKQVRKAYLLSKKERTIAHKLYEKFGYHKEEDYAFLKRFS